MPKWSGKEQDPVRSAKLVAARWGGKASYNKLEAPLAEAGMKSASQEDRAYALTQLTEVVSSCASGGELWGWCWAAGCWAVGWVLGFAIGLFLSCWAVGLGCWAGGLSELFDC